MPSTNITYLTTSFIGRTKELAEVKLLLGRTRLLTFTGVGGCGKTRLALQAAIDLLVEDLYPDGIWWVDLVGLSDPSLLPNSVTNALGVREAPDTVTLVEAIKNYISEKDLLLIFDNCEHLLADCGRLIQNLVSACPNLHVLTTSREALGIAGELSWLVPSLALPEYNPSPSSNLITAYAIDQNDAVRLFIDRALLIRPTFKLTDENAKSVMLICRRLDGLPLAIELAAARVNVLSVQQIAERLDDCFTILTAGNRTALIPRHETLRATLDWSFDLLTEQEQILFRRLAVFSGSFTLEALESICIDANIHRKDVLNLLSNLIDKSLVTLVSQESESARYRLLETVRQYALEKLQEAGEDRIIRSQHSKWFLALAEKADDLIHGPEQLNWLSRLELDHDNLRGALSSCLEKWQDDDWVLQNINTGTRLAGSLFWFWYLHGYISEGRYWFEKIIAESDLSRKSPALAKLLQASGELARIQGDHSTELIRNEQSVAMWQRLIDDFEENQDTARTSKAHIQFTDLKKNLALALLGLGGAQSSQGHANEGIIQTEKSIQILEDIGAKWELGYVLYQYAVMNVFIGDPDLARSNLDRSLRIFHELSDQRGSALVFQWQGIIALEAKDYLTARPVLAEALSIFQKFGDKWNIARTYNIFGEIARSEGEDEHAYHFYEQAIAIYRELGSKWGLCASQHNLGYVMLHRNSFTQAHELFLDTLKLNIERKDLLGTGSCLGGLASVAMNCDALISAAQLFGKMQAVLEESGLVLVHADFLEYERNLSMLRTRLDPSAFEEAWKSGLGLTIEQAIDIAQKIPLPPPPMKSTEAGAKLLSNSLSSRELEILKLIAKGASNQEIALKLFLAVSTVKWYINILFEKLYVHSRTQAVARARELGLL